MKLTYRLINLTLVFTLILIVPNTNQTSAALVDLAQTLYIDENSDLSSFPGSGTDPSDPKRIENYKIDHAIVGSLGINIENIDLYVVIQDCEFYGDDSMIAIELRGIADQADNIVIKNNLFDHTGLWGIVSWDNNWLTFENNNVKSSFGVFLWITGQGNFSVVSDNRFTGGAGAAVALDGNLNAITDNLFQEHGTAALQVSGTNMLNLIADNTFYDSDPTAAVVLDDSVKPLGGSANFWSRNYYSNYAGTGDYLVDGVRGSIDRNPKTIPPVPTTTSVSENTGINFGISVPIITLGIVSTYRVVTLKKRKKLPNKRI